MRLCGLEIDFVNLRSESYTEGQRIPSEMRFGSAVEDANRRDFTINALFYNVNSGLVEDLTTGSRGIPDMRDGILRTPLEPFQTFLDDPLRLLRAVRFASRYAFRLDEGIASASQHPQIRDALANGVSRDRFGIEFRKILRSKRPGLGVLYSEALDLLPGILASEWDAADTGAAGDAEAASKQAAELPSHEGSAYASSGRVAAWMMRAAAQIAAGTPASTALVDTATAAAELGELGDMEHAMRTWATAAVGGTSAPRSVEPEAKRQKRAGKGAGAPVDSQFLCMLAALQLPHQGELAVQPVTTSSQQQEQKKKKKNESMVRRSIMTMLKFRNQDAGDVERILGSLGEIRAASAAVPSEGLAEPAEPALRARLGLLVRSVKSLWRVAILVAMVDEIACLGNGAEGGESAVVDDMLEIGSTLGEAERHAAIAGDLEPIVLRYARLAAAIDAWGLGEAWTMRPLLNGRDLAQQLQLPKGPAVGKALAELIEWQLANPTGTAEQAVAALQRSRA